MNAVNILNTDSSNETVATDNTPLPEGLRFSSIETNCYYRNDNPYMSITFSVGEAEGFGSRYYNTKITVMWSAEKPEGERLSYRVVNAPEATIGDDDLSYRAADLEESHPSIESMIQEDMKGVRDEFSSWKIKIQRVHQFIRDMVAFMDYHDAEAQGFPAWCNFSDELFDNKCWSIEDNDYLRPGAGRHHIFTTDKDDKDRKINQKWVVYGHEDFENPFIKSGAIRWGQAMLDQAVKAAEKEELNKQLDEEVNAMLLPVVDQVVRTNEFLKRKLKASLTTEDLISNKTVADILQKESADAIGDRLNKLGNVAITQLGLDSDCSFSFKYKGDEYYISSLKDVLMDLREAKRMRGTYQYEYTSTLESRVSAAAKDRLMAKVIDTNDSYISLRPAEEEDKDWITVDN